MDTRAVTEHCATTQSSESPPAPRPAAPVIPSGAEQAPAPRPAAPVIPAGAEQAPAFESFFRANYTAVTRIAHSVLGDADAAEDVAQDVLIAAERRFAGTGWTPQAVAHAESWVRTAAVHTALNALRSRKRRGARDARHLRSRSAAAQGSPAEPEEAALGGADRAAVRQALARLPQRSSAVLLLRYGGLSYGEVADAMGVRIGHVGTMLRRAEAALRKEMQKEMHKEIREEAEDATPI